MTLFMPINRWSDIPHAISRAHQAKADHRVPFLQGLYNGRIAHWELQRTSSARQFKLWAAASRLPAVALLGDDDHATPDGPDTWPLTRRVFGWARFILIHGGAGRPEHYEYAIHLAESYGKLAMVECSSVNIAKWQAAAERWAIRAEGQIMQPPPGCPHPSLDRGSMS